MSYEINFGPWGSIFAVPTAVADRYLKFCTEEQLKVLLLALRQGQGPVNTAGIAARLGMDEAAVTDCLQYWQESGLFTENQNPQPAKEAPKAPENNESAVVKTTENGITTIRSRGHLSPGEINTMLREDKQFAALAAELEAARGSVLSPSEREILAYLFGSLELSPEYLLVAAAYCREKGKKKLSYLEKMVAGWLEDGIDTYEKAESHIQRLTKQEDDEGRIRRLFGLPERALTAREKACVNRWFGEYMTPEALMKLAYDRAVEATGKVSFAYIDKILAAWAAKGITTVTAAMPDAPMSHEHRELKTLTEGVNAIYDGLDALRDAHVAAEAIADSQEQANAYAHKVRPAMDALRAAVDAMEPIVASDYWPVPTYDDMLFYC